MRNITVSVDDDTYRRSRIRAAELDTSVSALVRTFLRSLVGNSGRESTATAPEAGSPVELRRRELAKVLADFDARGVGLRSRDNLTRDELYDRDRTRAEAIEADGWRGGDLGAGARGT